MSGPSGVDSAIEAEVRMSNGTDVENEHKGVYVVFPP